MERESERKRKREKERERKREKEDIADRIDFEIKIEARVGQLE